MDSGLEHYYQLNIKLLSTIGLWPYGNTLVLRLKRFIGGFLSAFGCFGQLATFFTVDYTRALFLQNLPCIFVGCSTLLKYISFLVASDTIKEVTKTINCDWKNLSSNEEIRIIEKYGDRSKFYTKSFAMLIWAPGVCLLILPLYPLVLDIVKPLNESRSRSIPIMFEAFFDQQKHFFVAVSLFESCIVVSVLVFVATETLTIVYIQHACLLFEATSRRIRKFLYSTRATNSQTISNDAIAQVVNIHSRAIRYCKKIREAFFPPYLILLAFGILSLGAYLFRCTQTIATHEYTEFLTSAMFSLTILGHMSFLTLVVQRLIDSSVNIFNVLYDGDWYTLPTSSRKLVLLCMLHSIKPRTVDMYNIFSPSNEGFCLIVRITMTYVTALFSLQ